MRYAMLTATHLSSHDDQKYVVDKYSDPVLRHTFNVIEPGQVFRTADVRDAPGLMHLADATRTTYVHLILSNVVAAFPKDSGQIIRQSKMEWKRATHPTVSNRAVSMHQFEERTGRQPRLWELDIANCPAAGTLGHYACGWCGMHNQPVLWCGCRYRKE